MAKKRYINTKFWSDTFIVELNPLDRYLFLYLLTNEHTDICGIYELPWRVMARETGLDDEMLKKMFKRLEGKVYYLDGWVCLKNFQKHQAINPKIEEGIKRSLSEVPANIKDSLNRLGIDYDSLSIDSELLNLNLNSNLTLENSSLSYEEPLRDTYKTKAKVYEKLGIPYAPPKKSVKQSVAWDTELLARYIQDKAMEIHRIEVYVNKSESGKGWKSLAKAIKEFGLDKCKEMADFYLNSEKFEKFGADVATMFSEHSINAFLTKPKKTIKPTAWAGDLPLYGNKDIQEKLNNKIIKFNQLKQSYEKI